MKNSFAAMAFVVKSGLHLNVNRMRMRHVKTKRMSDLDLLPRRGKQHSTV